MKSPHPRTKAPKRPKAKLVFTDPMNAVYGKRETLSNIATIMHDAPAALVPCTTAKAAKFLVKVANMTHEERVELVAKVICNDDMLWDDSEDCERDHFRDKADAVLSALGFTPDKAEDKA